MAMRLPPGYALYRFPSQNLFHNFAQDTGHGSHCQYLERGVLAGIHEGEDGEDSWPARYARHWGARRCREQPPGAPAPTRARKREKG